MAVSQPNEASAESPETIEELFAALESPLLSYALRLTGERDVAEDLWSRKRS
jgi:DNA-directed RNA polymerase specialized sigma24 family protein